MRKNSLERRIWKFKNNGGWNKYISKKYDVNDYYININDTRLQKLLNNPQKEEIEVLYHVFDFNLIKQWNRIPLVHKIPTYLFTRLDADIDSIIKLNYDRKENGYEKNSIKRRCII